MTDLVKMINEKPLVSTFDLYEKMGYKEHRMLKKIIQDDMADFEEYEPIILDTKKPTSKTGGRPIEAFMLDEDQFILLVTYAKNNREVKELKRRVVREFRRVRKVLASVIAQQHNAEWLKVRSDGKIAHRKKTDTIKRFAEYCDANGSKSSFRYYKNLADMENKALFNLEQDFKNIRNALSIRQLDLAISADIVIDKALVDGMEQELDYHDIYKLVKKRVAAFTVLLGRSPVHELIEQSQPTLELEPT